MSQRKEIHRRSDVVDWRGIDPRISGKLFCSSFVEMDRRIIFQEFAGC